MGPAAARQKLIAGRRYQRGHYSLPVRFCPKNQIYKIYVGLEPNKGRQGVAAGPLPPSRPRLAPRTLDFSAEHSPKGGSGPGGGRRPGRSQLREAPELPTAGLPAESAPATDQLDPTAAGRFPCPGWLGSWVRGCLRLGGSLVLGDWLGRWVAR